MNRSPRRPLPLFPGSALLLALALLWATPVRAGEITLAVTATTRVTADAVEAEYELRNMGSDPAAQVSLQATFFDQSQSAEVAESIGPGEAKRTTLKFTLPPNVKGTFPLYTQAKYRDPGDIPFSIAALAMARTEESPAANLTLTPVNLPKWGARRVDVSTTEPGVTSVTLTCYPPADLSVKPQQVNVKLTGGKGSAEFRIRNRSGTAGSNYVIFFAGEYDLRGVHYLSETRTTLPIQASSGGGPIQWGRAWHAALYTCIALAALGMVVAFFSRAAREGMRSAFSANRWPLITLEIVALIAIEIFIISNVSPKYLVTDTITTGGDTGSHYYTVWYMRHWLLPHGKVSDWTPGNYAGFPILQFYFPLPFLTMCLLNLVIPLTVAFKLVSLLGTFLLPIAAYLMLRLMRVPFPGPTLGAAFTLPFLFNGANSMWGGNILSTLAGEFSYSLSMALSLILLGSLYRGCLSNRRVILNGFLVFLVGFSHGYTLLFCEAMSLFFLLTPNGFIRRLVYLGKVYALGFCLLAFWLVPLLAFSKWTTPYHTVWTIYSIKEVLPDIILPYLVMAGAGVVGLVVWGAWAYRTRGAGALQMLAFFFFGFLVAGVMFVAAPKLGVVDIRYVPYAQLISCLAAALALGWLGLALNRVGLAWPLAIVGVSATLVWVAPQVGPAPSWCKWNYEGFEAKKGPWEVFHRLNSAIAGSWRDPRVVFEHSSDHNQFGTTRAFESLPLFAGDMQDPGTGRATLEGLYMQASISAPFVFYIQSEISQEKSCPFPQYTYATMDYQRAKRHLQMFNVRDLIIKSPQAKHALRLPQNAKDYELARTFGDYELWQLRSCPERYVEPLRFEPVLYTGKDWKPVAHQWFTTDSLLDVEVVFESKPTAEDRTRFKTVASLAELPRAPIDLTGCKVEETITNNEVIIKTNWLHKPLLVKMSQHPNWHVEGADKVYLASPSFMIVYPNRETVRLYYGPGVADKVGYAFGAAGLLALLLNIPIPGRRRSAWSLLAEKLRVPESLEPRLPWNPSPRARWTLLAVTGLLAAALIGGASYRIYTHEPHRLFNTSVRLKDAKRFDEARQGFRRVQDASPASALAHDSAYYVGICYYLEGDDLGAISAFQDLIRRYPNSNWVPESLYHIGICQFRMAQGKTGTEAQKIEKEGIENMALVVEKHPGSRYAEYARDRLREHNALSALLPRDLPADPGARMGVAIGFFNQDRIDEAMPLFEDVWSKNPDHPAAPMALATHAMCYYKKQRYAETIKFYEQFVKRYPKDALVPEALFHIGLAHERLDQKDKAVQNYLTVREMYPNDRYAKSAAERLKELGVP